MLLMLLLIPLQWPVIVMCPPHYLLSNVPLCHGTITVNVLIKGNSELGIRLIGQPTMTLCLLLKGLRLSPIVFIKDHFISSCNHHLWWNLTKNISGISKTHNRSTPDVDIDIDSLASYFASKLSSSPDFNSSSSTVPQEPDATYKKVLEGETLQSPQCVKFS